MHHLTTTSLITKVDIRSKESNVMCGCRERTLLLRKKCKEDKKFGDGKKKEKTIVKGYNFVFENYEILPIKTF
jgi:hypothetical protein